MKGKQLIILTLLALVLGGLALWSTRKEAHRTTPSQMGRKLLPDLQQKLNDVNAIVIRSASGTATVGRLDGIWRVGGRQNYPAEFGKVRDLLTKLADVKILQAMRSSPNLLKDLQLAAEGGADGQATVIELQDKTGKALASLRVGKPRTRAPATEEMSAYGSLPDGRFVAVGNEQVYLIGDPLNELAAADRDWLDHDLFTVNNSDLVALTVTGATTGVARLERPASGGEWVMTGLPAGKVLDSSKATGLASAMGFLRFEDLADSQLTPAQTGMDQPVTVQGKTLKGEIYTVRIGKATEDNVYRYASFSAAFEAPPEPAPTGGTNDAAVAKARAEEQARTAADVKQLNDKISPWVYLLNRYQVESLIKGQADLIKDAQEAKQAEPQEAP
jgi:hypothetical protein